MSDLPPIGKWLIALGLLLVGVGILILMAGKIPYIGRLPGDIRIERDNFKFYFPLTTSILLSIAFSFIFWLFSRLK
jgi:hypothetical protein